MVLDRATPSRPRARALVVAVLVCAVLASCGGETASTNSTGQATDAGSSAATSVAAPSVTAGSTVTATAASPSTTSIPSSTTTASKRATVYDLERDLEATINDDGSNPGRALCEARGTLSDWQAVLCYYHPEEPAEFGGIHVAIFDHNRYAWALGECCAGGPWVEAYAPGLYCRDLLKPPSDGMEHPEEYHLSYGLAVWYWLKEGRPDRMDADGNGVPCETVYPESEVDKYWASARTIP